MARRKRRPGDPLRQQVSLESDLRYASSNADLSGARRQNYRQYQADVDTAEDSAVAIKKAAKQAVGELRTIYNDADRTRTQAVQQINLAMDVAKAPGSAIAFALQAEREGATRRFAAERAGAQADQVSRGQEATSGLVFQKENAKQTFRANRADIVAKQRDIRRDRGQFEQARYGELQQARADAELKEADRIADEEYRQATLDQGQQRIDISRGIDPATGKRLKKPRTKAEQQAVNRDTADVREKVTLAKTWLDRLSQAKGGSREKAAKLLETGQSISVPAPSGKRDKSGKAVPRTDARGQVIFTQMAVPQINPDFVRAALEISTSGLSKQTAHLLRSTYNVHLPKDWLPKPYRLPQNFRSGR